MKRFHDASLAAARVEQKQMYSGGLLKPIVESVGVPAVRLRSFMDTSGAAGSCMFAKVSLHSCSVYGIVWRRSSLRERKHVPE